jgi:hypothetical protein
MIYMLAVAIALYSNGNAPHEVRLAAIRLYFAACQIEAAD